MARALVRRQLGDEIEQHRIVRLINRIGLCDEEKDKVYYRNAKQLLKL